MVKRFYKEKKHYMDASRKHKKLMCIQHRNELRKSTPFLGGIFTTYDVIDGVKTQWADIVFLSKRYKNVLYNVTIETAKLNFFDKIESQSLKEFHSYAEEAAEEEDIQDFLKSYGMRTQKIEEYLGVSQFDWLAKRNEELSHQCVTREYCKKDKTYRYGIGLYIVIDVPALSIEAINGFIEAFWKGGEQEWMSNRTRTYDMEDHTNVGVCNAVAEPQEWVECVAEWKREHKVSVESKEHFRSRFIDSFLSGS